MQLQLSLLDPGLILPVFRLKNVGSTSAEVLYQSGSSDLMRHFMEGIVSEAARLFCGVEIAMERRQNVRGNGHDAATGSAEKPSDSESDEEVYLLTFPFQPETDGVNSCCERFLLEKRRLESQASACIYAPSPALFYQMFPFHFLLDQKCQLIQASERYQGPTGSWP